MQEKKIIRVGGDKQRDVDIRIITATHQDLNKMVNQGLFRSDLRFRLNVFPIAIPPLRDRKSDIPALVDHFIEKKAKELRISGPVTPSAGAMNNLMTYDWPGNVRELENVVERALILCRNGRLSFENTILEDKTETAPESSKPMNEDHIETMDKLIAAHIKRALKTTNGKIHGPKGAAEVLGINASTLRHRMRKLGIRAYKI